LASFIFSSVNELEKIDILPDSFLLDFSVLFFIEIFYYYYYDSFSFIIEFYLSMNTPDYSSIYIKKKNNYIELFNYYFFFTLRHNFLNCCFHISTIA